MEHTPGPWAVHNVEWTDVDGNTTVPIITNAPEMVGRRMIGTVRLDNLNGDGRANAHLIAAAPDMLEALKEIAEGKGRYSMDPFTHACNTVDDMKELARQAIALVEGRV